MSEQLIRAMDDAVQLAHENGRMQEELRYARKERDASLSRAETAERQVEQLRAALINLKRQSIRTAAHTDECMGVVNESPCICGLEAAYVETEAALAATAPTVKTEADAAPAAGGGE